MTTPSFSSLTDAERFLKQFDCLNPDEARAMDYAPIRAALAIATEQSDYQILGVCASSLDQGTQALLQYAQALGYTPEPQFEPVDGAVYIKFNPRTGLCYAKSYTGHHRGVLVSCQADFSDGHSQMYGHLPLDLFDAV
ncbi:MAG: DUF1824 family protein [Cyanobacteria bacterium J06638_20]